MSNRATWEIWLDDPRGVRLKSLSKIVRGHTFTRIANDIGDWALNLPGDFDWDLLHIDSLVEFWRKPVGGSLRWIGVGFIRRLAYRGWPAMVTIGGPDATELLIRRIVAYAAGSAQAEQTDYLDDMAKAIITQNFGSGATAARNLVSLGLSVAPDLSAAPSTTKSFAWENALLTLQKLAETSRSLGTELYFDLAPVLLGANQIGFEFRTSTGQIGRDHTFPDGDNPVLFGPEWGNLENPELEYDYGEEVNYIYAGGQGEEGDREIVEVTDAARSGLSVWNRREGFADARNESTTAGVTAKGNEALAAGRPRLHFGGELKDTKRARYGLHWEFGDRVSATYLGRQFDGMVRATTSGRGADGRDNISARMEIDE